MKRADGTVEYLRTKSGPPLAVMDAVGYRRQTLSLAPNDGFVLYTDGVTEATDHARVQYGESRLAAALRSLLGERDSEAIVSGIIRDVGGFVSGAEQADDITLLAFKLIGLAD